jgi:hypothetical protein
MDILSLKEKPKGSSEEVREDHQIDEYEKKFLAKTVRRKQYQLTFHMIELCGQCVELDAIEKKSITPLKTYLLGYTQNTTSEFTDE